MGSEADRPTEARHPPPWCEVPRWLRPPHHLLVLFICLTAVSATALAWLGWQWVQQDQALADTRADQRRKDAVGLAVAALQKQLAEVETALSDLANLPDNELVPEVSAYAQRLAADSVLLVFQNASVAAHPPGRLLYYPTLPGGSAADEAMDAVFENAEALELGKNDVAGAVAVLETLVRSSNPAVQAEALVRLGRNYSKAHRWTDAEAAYERLARPGVAKVRGIPAELLARDASIALREKRGDASHLSAEAASLFLDLHNARWELTLPLFDHYDGRARQWLGANVPPVPQPGAEAIAAAAGSLWESWRAGKGSTRRQTVRSAGRSVLVVERTSPARMVAFVAGPGFVESTWAATLEPLAETHGARVVLSDNDGQTLAGTPLPSPGPQHSGVSTGLPWMLSIVPVDSAVAASERETRRRLVTGGLLAIALLVVGGSYLIGRAVARELAVARVQSDFVAAVSHEFRTPLTALRQLSELLARGRVPSEEMRQQYYGVLEQESSRLHRLVEGLLKFGRMEAGMAKYQFETIDVAAFLRSLVDEFGIEAGRRGCRVELKMDGSMAAARADREALGCVVWNLLDNAVKYSPDCRTVWVDLAREDGCVAIRVRDEGVGISPKERQRVFQKFVRGGAAQTLNVQGTGIGLAVGRQIVERHGGKIHLDSEPGKGSTFTVLLPAAGGASA